MNDNTASPDLVKICEVFMIPCSVLITAVGAMDTNGHRACVCLLGLVISSLWLVCSREAFAEQQGLDGVVATGSPPMRVRIMLWLPALFSVSWGIGAVAHIVLWCRQPGS